MTYCYGTTGLVQADCGSSRPHDGHDDTATEAVCAGSWAPFVEAECGRPGLHGVHPMTQVPR